MPLFPALTHRQPMTRRRVGELVSGALRVGAIVLEERSAHRLAAHLATATTLWVRHAFGNRITQHVPLNVAQRLLRHESIANTRIYVQEDEVELHTALDEGLQ